MTKMSTARFGRSCAATDEYRPSSKAWLANTQRARKPRSPSNSLMCFMPPPDSLVTSPRKRKRQTGKNLFFGHVAVTQHALEANQQWKNRDPCGHHFCLRPADETRGAEFFAITRPERNPCTARVLHAGALAEQRRGLEHVS